jgi:hypothetical protein
MILLLQLTLIKRYSEPPANNTIEIPIADVSTTILQRIVEFCEHHTIVEPMMTIEKPLQSNLLSNLVQNYYVEFVNVEVETLCDLIMAARFMKIIPLLHLTCAKMSIFWRSQSFRNSHYLGH